MYKTAHSPFKQTIMCKIKSCLCPQIESQDRAFNIFIRTKKNILIFTTGSPCQISTVTLFISII